MAQHSERAQFIEETGLIFEKLGVTRMAGRILGFLMVSDKEMVSFDELTQVLQASKSSISTNIRTLIQIRFVKQATQPGDRKTYYMLSPEMSWSEFYSQRMKKVEAMNDLFKKGARLRVNKQDLPSQWLDSATRFYDWVGAELPKLIARFEEKQKTTR